MLLLWDVAFIKCFFRREIVLRYIWRIIENYNEIYLCSNGRFGLKEGVNV